MGMLGRALIVIVFLILAKVAQNYMVNNSMERAAEAPGWLGITVTTLWIVGILIGVIAAIFPNDHRQNHNGSRSHGDYLWAVMIPIGIALALMAFQCYYVGKPIKLSLESGLAPFDEEHMNVRSARNRQLLSVQTRSGRQVKLLTKTPENPLTGYAVRHGFTMAWYVVEWETLDKTDSRDPEVFNHQWEDRYWPELGTELAVLADYIPDANFYEWLKGYYTAPEQMLPEDVKSFVDGRLEKEANERQQREAEEADRLKREEDEREAKVARVESTQREMEETERQAYEAERERLRQEAAERGREKAQAEIKSSSAAPPPAATKQPQPDDPADKKSAAEVGEEGDEMEEYTGQVHGG